MKNISDQEIENIISTLQEEGWNDNFIDAAIFPLIGQIYFTIEDVRREGKKLLKGSKIESENEEIESCYTGGN